MNQTHLNQLKTLSDKLMLPVNIKATDGTFQVITAICAARMMATATGKTLAPFRDVKFKWFLISVDEQAAYWSYIKGERQTKNVQDSMLLGCKEQFIKMLCEDTVFKRSVGGTKWEVDLDYFRFEYTEYDRYNGPDAYIDEGLEPADKLKQVFERDQDYVLLENFVTN